MQHVKSPRELDVFREAGEISTRALNLVMEDLLVGKTEAEAGMRGAAEVIRCGGVPTSFASRTAPVTK